MIYLFQRMIQNHFQWTRPSPGRLGPVGEGAYVQENGFGHEDWNFNTNLLINGLIYGYCYYSPTKAKREETFNIAFAAYTAGQWHLVGFYLNANFVEEPPVNRMILRQRMRDLKQLGGSLGKPWGNLSDEGVIDKLAEDALSLRWCVNPENVVRTAQPIPIPLSLFDTKNYRIAKPTQLNQEIFEKLYSLAESEVVDYDYADEVEFPEGRELERKHKVRERNGAVIVEAKRAFEKNHGGLFCQLCGFDFFKVYGEVGRGFIEGHHTVALGNLKGEIKSKPSDIAVVCSNCHRMLHRRRPWLTMKDLKNLLTENTVL